MLKVKETNSSKDRVQEAIDFYDRLEAIEPSPYFHAKLKRRIEQSSEPERRSFSIAFLFKSLQLRPVLLSFLLFVNLLTVILFLTTADSQKTDKIVSDSVQFTYYQSVFRSDYSIYRNSYVNQMNDRIEQGSEG